MGKKVHNLDRPIVRASDAMGIRCIEAQEFCPSLGDSYSARACVLGHSENLTCYTVRRSLNSTGLRLTSDHPSRSQEQAPP
jgi:hypothetical protein